MSQIAEEKDIQFGKNGLYSLQLVRSGSGAVEVWVRLSVRFSMIPYKSDPSIKWGDGEDQAFVKEWNTQIKNTWNSRNIMQHKGNNISVIFETAISVGGYTTDTQWQIEVQKAPSMTFPSSWIGRTKNSWDGLFDSADGRKKSNIGDGTQTGMIHEFGHMIGLEDEYDNTDYKNYSDSVMHRGSKVYPRHYKHLLRWATDRIDSAVS